MNSRHLPVWDFRRWGRRHPRHCEWKVADGHELHAAPGGVLTGKGPRGNADDRGGQAHRHPNPRVPAQILIHNDRDVPTVAEGRHQAGRAAEKVASFFRRGVPRLHLAGYCGQKFEGDLAAPRCQAHDRLQDASGLRRHAHARDGDLANLAANFRGDLFGSWGPRRGAQRPDIQRHAFSGRNHEQMLDPGVAEIDHVARRQSSHRDLKSFYSAHRAPIRLGPGRAWAHSPIQSVEHEQCRHDGSSSRPKSQGERGLEG